MGLMTKEEDIVVASDSKSKLWKDRSLKRAIPNWSMKCVDVARSAGSASRVFTCSERLANQLKINEIGQVGKLVKQSEMGDSKGGNMMRKIGSGPQAGQ